MVKSLESPKALTDGDSHPPGLCRRSLLELGVTLALFATALEDPRGHHRGE